MLKWIKDGLNILVKFAIFRSRQFRLLSVGRSVKKYYFNATYCTDSFSSSRPPYFHIWGEKTQSKMALRTVCAAVLRNGTDLGVNNARTFVTTGIVTILLNYFVFSLRNFVTRLQHCMTYVRTHPFSTRLPGNMLRRKMFRQTPLINMTVKTWTKWL